MKSGTPAPPAGPSLEMEPLDLPTRRLLAFAAAVAAGRQPNLRAQAAALNDAAAPAGWVDELLLQSVLMVGYPRALVAAGVWRAASGQPAPATDSTRTEGLADWEARGIETCRVVYGDNYERLRANVRTLHPALDHWMVIEGYGRVLSRPGLDLARRELCSVAQIAVLGTPRQLHSHLRGALQAGATAPAVSATLEEAEPFLTSETRRIALEVWSRVIAKGQRGQRGQQGQEGGR